MCTFFDYIAVFKHYYLIGILYGTQSMCYYNNGFSFIKIIEIFND